MFHDEDVGIGSNVGKGYQTGLDRMHGDGRDSQRRRFRSLRQRFFAAEHAFKLEVIAGRVDQRVIVHITDIASVASANPGDAEFFFVRHGHDGLFLTYNEQFV